MCGARGLRARTGYEVSMQWKGGKLTSAGITAKNAGPSQIRSGRKTATVTFKAGQTIHLGADLVRLDDRP